MLQLEEDQPLLENSELIPGYFKQMRKEIKYAQFEGRRVWVEQREEKGQQMAVDEDKKPTEEGDDEDRQAEAATADILKTEPITEQKHEKG